MKRNHIQQKFLTNGVICKELVGIGYSFLLFMFLFRPLVRYNFLFDDPGIRSLERIQLAPITLHQSLAGEPAEAYRRAADHPM